MIFYSLALVINAVISGSYFYFRDDVEGFVNRLYYDHNVSLLKFLAVSPLGHDAFKTLYMPIVAGLAAGLVPIGILKFQDSNSPLMPLAGAVGLFLGVLAYWWFHPDRTSPRFGGGSLFSLGIGVSFAILVIGFIIPVLIYGLKLKFTT